MAAGYNLKIKVFSTTMRFIGKWGELKAHGPPRYLRGFDFNAYAAIKATAYDLGLIKCHSLIHFLLCVHLFIIHDQ